MHKSKTVLVGLAMVAVGGLKMVWPDIFTFIEADPELLIGNGFGFIFARFAIAKNGQGV